MEPINELLQAAMNLLASVAAMVIIRYAIPWLVAKITEVRSHIDTNVLTILDAAATIVVGGLEQEKQRLDLTPEQVRELAISRLQEFMTSRGYSDLSYDTLGSAVENVVASINNLVFPTSIEVIDEVVVDTEDDS